jgi:hypothetical protein
LVAYLHRDFIEGLIMSFLGSQVDDVGVYKDVVNTTQDFIVDIPKYLIDVHWFGHPLI